jgi:hypothetical protein
MRSKGIVVAFVGLVLGQAGPAGAAQSARPDARQAQGAVQRAEEAVRHAWAQRSLWTTAQEALEQARAAAARGDYQAAVEAARFAVEQAELGMGQMRYRRFDE